jgi:Ca-activated chloride channel family protein
VNRQILSAPFSLLMLVAASLGISALGGLSHTSAQAQAPINGNIYQNQQGLQQPSGPDNVMIILDGSDSMADAIDRSGESKMAAAKRTVLDVLRTVSPATRVGLRIYGNSASPFNACHATSVLVPLGENNRNLIASKMIGIQPTGMTPISYTIMRSLNEDFQAVSGPRTIILISDGIETCGEDPCHVAVRMQQMGINVKINVIGLGLQDYDADKQLRCVALGTKGQFYTANTAAELANSLNKAMAAQTKVQGTILTPITPSMAPRSPAPLPMQAQPQPQRQYQETVLPAAVPIDANKR